VAHMLGYGVGHPCTSPFMGEAGRGPSLSVRIQSECHACPCPNSIQLPFINVAFQR
jgi:hypothetical protein